MVRNFLKLNQIRNKVLHVYLDYKTKRSFAIACLGKKFSFSYGNLLLFQISNFKNRSFSSGQELVQFEPNSIWSIHVYLEFNAEGIFVIALLGKKLEFHTEICVYFKYLINADSMCT